MEKETQLKSKVDNLQVLIKDLKLVTNLSTDVSSESSPCQNFSHSPTKSAKCIRMTLFDEDGEKDVGKKIVTELKRKIDSLQTTIHEVNNPFSKLHE